MYRMLRVSETALVLGVSKLGSLISSNSSVCVCVHGRPLCSTNYSDIPIRDIQLYRRVPSPMYDLDLDRVENLRFV